jgi:hypothetical protein
MKWDRRIAEALMLRMTGSIDYKEMVARIEVVLNAMDAEDEIGQLYHLLAERDMIIDHLRRAENLGSYARITRQKL